MKTIIVRRLDLQFAAGQITHGQAAQQVDRAVELINQSLQQAPAGLQARLLVHREEIEIETQPAHA